MCNNQEASPLRWNVQSQRGTDASSQSRREPNDQPHWNVYVQHHDGSRTRVNSIPYDAEHIAFLLELGQLPSFTLELAK
jgi:hypothetical protein